MNGWIEKLYANQEGMEVAAGQPLFELYSPEITATADELITARKMSEDADGRTCWAKFMTLTCFWRRSHSSTAYLLPWSN